jgi:hypothetical protein
MLSGIIAYQVLQQESPQTIDKVKAVLEKHPWYANQWQARLQDVPAVDHGVMLFMEAARWPDDIRIKDKQYQGAVALHQLAVQTRGTTSECPNQRARASEHPNGDGRE